MEIFFCFNAEHVFRLGFTRKDTRYARTTHTLITRLHDVTPHDVKFRFHVTSWHLVTPWRHLSLTSRNITHILCPVHLQHIFSVSEFIRYAQDVINLVSFKSKGSHQSYLRGGMASFLTLSGQISSNSLPIQCKLPKSTDVVFELTAPRRLLRQKSGNLRTLMHSLNIKFFGCL